MAGNTKNNTEWLLEKLRRAECERDEAIEHAKDIEIDNLCLRMKLQAVKDILGDEIYTENMFIPNDGIPDVDIPEAEDDCVMPSI